MYQSLLKQIKIHTIWLLVLICNLLCMYFSCGTKYKRSLPVVAFEISWPTIKKKKKKVLSSSSLSANLINLASFVSLV